MVMPKLVHEGQKAMQKGSLLEARELFSTYLMEHDEGVFADGAKWAVASLPDVPDEPGTGFLKQIERLQTKKAAEPDSVYAPWALCSMGQLYWDAGWYSEANALFEEFLRSYPEHPMAGGVMVEAGLGYLENKQFLEAALVLRRVVEEPKWEAHRLRGALGLAQATAMSKAWRQAYYWYRVVEAESPELIRQSESSSYYYGLTELVYGDSDKAIPRFLTTVNLHPQHEFAGQALIRISEKLLKEGHEFLSLWFAEQAKRRFEGKEYGRRGQAAQTRWVVDYLSEEHSKEELVKVYRRLDDLEIYLSVSWDNVVETARGLSRAPEPDLVEESLLWMGRGYHMLEDIPAAIRSFTRLAIVANSEASRQEAKHRLGNILNKQIQSFYAQQAWVPLLKFHEDQQEAFLLAPLTRERVKIVAQAYQHVNLPSRAMQWYDQLLEEHPASSLREEIFAQKVFLADDQGNANLVRNAGEIYLREYPEGQWRAEVSAVLGMESLAREDYVQAIQELSDVVQRTHDKALQSYVLQNRVRAYLGAEKRDLALQDLRQIVAFDPTDMAAVIRLGDFLFDQGDFADAVPLYDQVLSSKAPVALKAWAKYRWGLSLDYQGKPTEAQKLLAEVRQLETRSPEFENTIRAAAVAVLNEFSLKGKPQTGTANEGS
jgi:tetratricopeptide (TPR) repeat protein